MNKNLVNSIGQIAANICTADDNEQLLRDFCMNMQSADLCFCVACCDCPFNTIQALKSVAKSVDDITGKIMSGVNFVEEKYL